MYTKKLFFSTSFKVDLVNKKHVDLIRDPVFNKGHSFSKDERDRLGLKGLLGHKQFDIQTQLKLNKSLLLESWKSRVIKLNDEIIQSGVHPDSIRKWTVLQNLQDNDETLFYRMLMNNFMEMAPIIYTPTVGWACMNFSQLLSRPRGMIFCAEDKGGYQYILQEMAAMVYNWPEKEVDAIVVTDGSRVLGLGDQGVGGLQISIGKLDLYVAGAGFNPRRVLPICLDVGTSNQRLLDDEHYLGLKSPRLEGDQYYEFVDEFICAIKNRYPKVLIQFEDFQLKHAMNLLKKYRDQEQMLCFNDDIQGTAATILAGLKGAMKVSKLDGKDLCNQKFVVCGAGSAGSGAIMTIYSTLVERYGMDPKDAANTFYILDKDGLISKDRQNIEDLKLNFDQIELFAKDDISMEGMTLDDVVDKVQPTVIIGLSAVKDLFSEKIVKSMAQNCERPIVFALSNPTSRSECNAEDVQRWTEGKAIFASGSPFNDVVINGRTIKSAQCNNSYIFPGLALGSHLCQPKIITDQMFRVAAEALVEHITEEDIQLQSCFPKLDNIREFSSHLAARVISFACEQNLATDKECIQKNSEGFDQLKIYVKEKMWQPQYRNLIYQKN